MRIAMLSYHTSPLAALGGKQTGGMNVYVRELSRHLAQLGHPVDVFTRAESRDQADICEIGPGARLITLPAGPPRPLEKNLLPDHMPAFALAVKAFAREHDLHYELIHGHYWMSGLVGVALKAAWGVPLIFMFHTLGLMKARIEQLGLRESERRIRGERQVLKAVDKVVAATPAESAQLQWLYEVRTPQITVIPPGVNLERFNPVPQAEARSALGIPRKGKVVLYVGRIEPLKGVDMLIQATDYLLKNQAVSANKLVVHIIGGEANLNPAEQDEDMRRLKSLTEKVALGEQVHFLGSRPQEVLPLHYSAADVVVVPSYYESFGMVALEAMACGAPVIASRVGGLAYLVLDGVTGYHVPEGYPLALAERLEALLQDDDLRRRLGASGRLQAQKYSWARVAGEIAELYEDLA